MFVTQRDSPQIARPGIRCRVCVPTDRRADHHNGLSRPIMTMICLQELIIAIFGPKHADQIVTVEKFPLAFKTFSATDTHSRWESNDIFNWLKLHLTHPSCWITRRRTMYCGTRMISFNSAGRAHHCLMRTRLRCGHTRLLFLVQG